MHQIFGHFFFLILSVSAPIDGQNNFETEFYTTLKDNNNKIDYIMNVQHIDKYDINMFMYIKDFVWHLMLTSNSFDEYSVDVDFMFPFRPTDELEYKDFCSETYALGFNVVDWKGKGSAIICSLTKDYQTLKYIHYPTVNQRRKADKTRNILEFFNRKGGHKSVVNSTRKIRKTYSNGVTSIKTGFEVSGFKPQLSFVLYSDSGENLIVFIETNVKNGKYTNRVRAYNSLLDKGLTEIVATDPRIPISIISAAEEYYIKGVADTQLEDTNELTRNGSILIIELCSKKDIPCTGNVSYHYCFAGENDITPTAKGKPCNKSKLKLLFPSKTINETVVPELPLAVDIDYTPNVENKQSEASLLTESDPNLKSEPILNSISEITSFKPDFSSVVRYEPALFNVNNGFDMSAEPSNISLCQLILILLTML